MKFIKSVVALQILSLLLLVGFAGCGGSEFGPIGEISGKLTMDGKVLPTGTKVLFMDSVVGHAGFAFTNEAGIYNIEWRRDGQIFNGLPIGNYQVMLIGAGGGAEEEIEEMSADDMLAGGADKVARAKPNGPRIPRKYMRASTSGLQYTVKEGENEINIDIPKS